MTNRAAVVLTAVVVGAGLYGGLVFVDERLRAPTGPASGGEVVPANTTIHLDRVGRPTVVGRVLNGRTSAVADVRVTVEFYRDGERIGTATDRALIPVIGPRQDAPFAVRLENRSARPDDYRVSLDYGPADARPYDGLTVEDATVADESQTQLILVGTVGNTGGRTVAVHVVATFFDEGGAVVGVRSVRPSPAELAPGDRAEYSIRYRTLGDVPSLASQVERFEVDVYGEPVG